MILRDDEETNLLVLVRQHFEERHPSYSPIQTIPPRITDSEILAAMQDE